MSNLSVLLARGRARLNPTVTVNHDFNDSRQWHRIVEPKAQWLTVLGFVAYAGLVLGVPLVLFGINNRAELLLLGPYWPLAWHFYMRKHYRPEFRKGQPSEGSPGSTTDA